jgi:KDO2-lipid IV(A) lauroyltransferase
MSKLPISFLLFQKFIKIIPLSWHYKIARGFAHIAYFLDKRHTKVAWVNLEIAFGDKKNFKEKKELILSSYENLFIVAIETILLQGISKEDLLNMVEFENEDILIKAIKSKKPITFFTGHYCNWELGILAIGANFLPLSIVGRPLDWKWADKILTATREQFGVKLIPKKRALKNLIKEIKGGRAIGIAVDQNTASKDGVLVDFFGKEARHTPAISILARKFDTIIIPVFDYRIGIGKYKVKFFEPIEIKKSKNVENDILALTQAQAKITQKIIEEEPKFWLWLHARWKNRYEKLYKKRGI